jgi:hypothetical protein
MLSLDLNPRSVESCNRKYAGNLVSVTQAMRSRNIRGVAQLCAECLEHCGNVLARAISLYSLVMLGRV